MKYVVETYKQQGSMGYKPYGEAEITVYDNTIMRIVVKEQGILLEISVDDIVKILRAEGIIECCTARDVQ